MQHVQCGWTSQYKLFVAYGSNMVVGVYVTSIVEHSFFRVVMFPTLSGGTLLCEDFCLLCFGSTTML